MSTDTTQEQAKLTLAEVARTVEGKWPYGYPPNVRTYAMALLASQTALRDAEWHVMALRTGSVGMSDRQVASLSALLEKLRAALLEKGEGDVSK